MKFPSKQTLVRALAVLAALCAATAFGLAQYLPEPVPREQTLGTSSPLDPSLANALTHIRRIASEPHVPGSNAQQRAGDYICAELESYGLTPIRQNGRFPIGDIAQINQALGWRSNEAEVRDYANMGDADTLSVSNIIAFLPLAPESDEAVLMLAHYDSVKFGPGAGDNAMSAATLLETARLLSATRAKRNLILLFTDGEEQGMLGATLYTRAADMPDIPAQKIVHVTNVECRGCSGAMLLFETSSPNYSLIRFFSRAVPHPVGNSIAQQVYRMMSSNTDFTVFTRARYQGINLSLIDGAHVYHTADDNPGNLSPASLWHYLRTVPPLARSLVNAPDLETRGGDAIFFPFFKGNLVVLPESIAFPLAALVLIWTFGLLYSLRAELKPLLPAFARQFATALLCAATGFIAVKIITLTTGVATEREFLKYAASGPIVLALSLLTLALCAMATYKTARVSPLCAMAAMLPLLAVLALAACFVFPGALYLFALPAIAQCLCLQLQLMRGKLAAVLRGCGVTLSLLVTSLIITPVAYLVYVALSLRMIYGALMLLSIAAALMFSAAWPFILGEPAKEAQKRGADAPSANPIN